MLSVHGGERVPEHPHRLRMLCAQSLAILSTLAVGDLAGSPPRYILCPPSRSLGIYSAAICVESGITPVKAPVAAKSSTIVPGL